MRVLIKCWIYWAEERKKRLQQAPHEQGGNGWEWWTNGKLWEFLTDNDLRHTRNLLIRGLNSCVWNSAWHATSIGNSTHRPFSHSILSYWVISFLWHMHAVVCWIVAPKDIILTPGTYGCELIWKNDLCGCKDLVMRRSGVSSWALNIITSVL